MMNVLLVDDEPWVLEGLRTMVNWGNFGFQVCAEAHSGIEALNIIQRLQPELVVTDIHMPALSGLELVEQSRKTMKRPPKFVILSGYDHFDYALTAMKHKVAEYLLKPIDEEEFETILERVGASIRAESAERLAERRMRSFFLNNLVNRLIQGERGEGLERQAAEAMNLKGDAELRCLLVETDIGSANLRERIQAYFPDVTDRSFQDSAGRVGVFVPTDECSSDRLEEIGLAMHRDLSGSLIRPVIIALSDPLRGMGSIRPLYLQSLEVSKSKRCQGKEGLFFYSWCKKTPDHRADADQKIKRLIDSVCAGHSGTIDCQVEELMASLASGLPDIELAKARIADLELTFCRRVAEMNGDPGAWMARIRERHGSLGEIKQYSALQSYVCGLCLKALADLSLLAKQNENNTIFHVIQFVDREFHTKLQLRDLSRQFHMNATYLGQLFKKTTGKPFNEYVNERRIEEAKKLLKRTQIKISEVALKVGYPKTDYFISKFKSHTGMLPSVYKHQWENRPAEE
ncbi:response regulator [Paenibacillus sp. VCA1]|uniref:response regulator transcription factor n=1 Tax=Paenibacillus sp. VCA1 TaxID=3039148 RepID=UPI00287279ED|nr:helix-turn-helix domain-containing protein [Paenibacillus sp. VCA1]MDR9856348.1 response regulator [Paenibacillus sp. VCA1]